MLVGHVSVVVVRPVAGEAAVLADVQLASTLLERVRQLDAVKFALVRLERTALRERLVATTASVWTHPCTTQQQYAVNNRVLTSTNKSDLRSLDFSVTRLLMKLFRTSNSDIIDECCSHFCFKLPSEILPARFDRFLCKLQQQLRL